MNNLSFSADAPSRAGQSVAFSAPRGADFRYLRLHGGSGRDGAYRDAELRSLSRRIRGWARRRDVYVYFNNDRRGHAVRDARRLRQLLGLDTAGERQRHTHA